MAGIDINRTTANVINDPEISQEIWANATEASFFMTHARRITIPGSGLKIQTITGEPTADWVEETGQKPISTHTFGTKTIIPYKMAVIEPFSMEFMRDKAALYDELVRRLPAALARKFDEAVLGQAPGTGFDTLANAPVVSLVPEAGGSVWGQLLAADASISAAGGIMDLIGVSPQGKTLLQGAVDGQGYPLFMNAVSSRDLGSILGASVEVNRGLYVPALGGAPIVGVAGDFSQAAYGMVESISIEFSREATLVGEDDEIINLWQRNMVACKAECEVTFVLRDVNQYALLTGATA